MTDEQCKRILREDIRPIILGNSPKAHRLALSIYLRYGLSSLLCASRTGILDKLNPAAHFLPLITDAEPRLVCEQLCDLSTRYEGTLLLLIPSSPEELSRLGDYRERLEETYLLLTEEEQIRRALSPCLRSVYSTGR